MFKVYISYRREDAAAHAGRIADHLGRRFGAEQILIDVPASNGNPAEPIAEALRSCRVMLVIIGPRWARAQDQAGRRCLADPDDLVRLEISLGFGAGISVIPVLVGGAVFPSIDEFPYDMRALATRSAIKIEDDDWRHDIDRLSDMLDRILTEETPRRMVPAKPTEPAPTAVSAPRQSAERISSGTDAFISHATEDHEWAHAIVSMLEQAGRRCWIAPRDIPPGTASYARAITRAIKSSRLMIVIVSSHSSASDDVLNEVTLAKNNNVLRLPVRFDAAPLDEGLEYFFSQSQWFNAADLTREEAIQRLLASVSRHLA